MEEKEVTNRMQRKLEEIARILCDSTDKIDNIGVLSGVSGLVLFMYYYSRYTDNSKYAEVGEQILEKAVEMINNGFTLHTFCSGIGGLAWTCEHLEQNGFIDRETFSFLNVLEPYLMSCMKNEFNNNNYDFLHGGLGVGYYFLSKKKTGQKNIDALVLMVKK